MIHSIIRIHCQRHLIAIWVWLVNNVLWLRCALYIRHYTKYTPMFVIHSVIQRREGYLPRLSYLNYSEASPYSLELYLRFCVCICHHHQSQSRSSHHRQIKPIFKRLRLTAQHNTASYSQTPPHGRNLQLTQVSVAPCNARSLPLATTCVP